MLGYGKRAIICQVQLFTYTGSEYFQATRQIFIASDGETVMYHTMPPMHKEDGHLGPMVYPAMPHFILKDWSNDFSG